MASSKKSITRNSSQPQFTEKETIVEILEALPQARGILFMYGLGCVGCHAGFFETLEEGVAAHGFSKDQFLEILKTLNLAAENNNNPSRNCKKM